MKQSLLFLLASMMAYTASAETATVVFGSLGYENGDDVTAVKVNDDISLLFAEHDGYRDAAFFEVDDAVRFFYGNSLTVSGAAGVEITGVEFTTVGGSYDFDPEHTTIDSGSMTFGECSATWAGQAESVEFVNATDVGNVRITEMKFTYSVSQSSSVAAPEFNLEENDFDFTVEISCATDGAEIHYTLDGTSPTAESSLYKAPIELYMPTTVKALAVKDGELSAVATFKADVPEYLPDFSALDDLSGQTVLIKAPMTVVYRSGKYLYLTCGGMYAMVFNTFNLSLDGLENGKVVKRLEGRVAVINNQTEILLTAIGEASDGQPVNPQPVETVEYLQGLVSHYLTLEHVSLSDYADGKGIICDSDGNTLELYNMFGITGVSEGKNLNVTGFVVGTGEELQFAPTAIEPAEEQGGSGISSAAADAEAAAPVYFNLQGVRVDNPSGGIYIVNRGGNIVKQTIK